MSENTVSTSTVTIVNRTQAEIVLSADIVKESKSKITIEPATIKFKRKNRLSGVDEEVEARLVTLPGMKKGSFSPNPVTMAAADWKRLENQAVVKGLMALNQLEVS